MSISLAITQAQQKVANAYTAISNKGGTLPATQNLANMPTAIASIPSGGGSDIGITREVKNGVYQMPTTSFTFSLPSDATDVGDRALYYAFQYCTGLTSVDLSSVTNIGGFALSNAFFSCSNITSVDLSSVTNIGSFGLQSAFDYCSRLTRIDLSSLTNIGNGGLNKAFEACKSITDIYFNSLTTSSFGSFTNQFNSMLNVTGNTTTHTLHFPSNLESTIQGLTGYPLFGGTNGYVVLSFDLPQTS